LTKKKKLSYQIREDLDNALLNYARAKGQTRTYTVTDIVEIYLSCKKIPEQIRNNRLKVPTRVKKDKEIWKRTGDYLLPSHYAKIKFIAINSKASISEVMDDILEKYLSKVDPKEALEETLQKVFNELL